MNKKLQLLIIFLLLSTQVFASYFSIDEQVFVHSTSYFDLIYSKETESTAALLSDKVDDLYSQLASEFDYKNNKRFPVVITNKEKDLNAFYSSFPSSLIVLYDTVDIPQTISYFDNQIISIFFHELVHAMSITNLEGAYKWFATIFGDTYNLHYLNSTNFDLEGISVKYESDKGFGRVNDPFTMQALVNNKASGKKLNLFDAQGNNSLSYNYGGMFANYVFEKFGSGLYNEFFSQLGKINLIPFNSTFSLDKEIVFQDFIESIKVPSFNTGVEVIKEDYSALYGNESNSFALKNNSLYRIEDFKKVGYYKGLSSVKVCGENVITKVRKNNNFSSFSFYLDGKKVNTSEDTKLLLKVNSNLYYLENDGQNLYLKGDNYSFALGQVQVVDALVVKEDIVLALFKEGNSYISYPFKGVEYQLPESLIIQMLSSFEDKLVFSYGRIGKPYEVPRFGYLEKNSLYLDENFYLGGVNTPLMLSAKEFLFISQQGEENYLLKAQIKEMREYQLNAMPLKSMELKSQTFETSKNYNLFTHLFPGTLLPYYAGINSQAMPFLGLSYYVSDPTSKLNFFLGADFNTKRVGITFYDSLNSRYQALGYEYDWSNNINTIYANYKNTFNFTPSIFSLGLSTSLYFRFNTTQAMITSTNSLDFIFSKRFAKGSFDSISFNINPMFNLGYLIGEKQIGYAFGGKVGLSFPLLFFLPSCTRFTYNAPLFLSCSVNLGTLYKLDASLLLFGFEINKAIPYLSLYAKRLGLYFDYTQSLSLSYQKSANYFSDILSYYKDAEHVISLRLALTTNLSFAALRSTKFYFNVSANYNINHSTFTLQLGLTQSI